MHEGLPAPLTPPDCDLQDFAFMPLDVVRLRDSDLASDESPAACWSAVLLWAAAWHQVPAASIPDNEKWIAKHAGYAQRGKIDKDWPDVRSGALRGWVKCSDGRLYHPVVAEKAKDAWQAKTEQRWRSECSRIKKHNQRHGTNIPCPDIVPWTNAGRPQGQPLPVPGDNSQYIGDVPRDKHSKRQGEGEGQGQGDLVNPPLPPKGKTKAPSIALKTFLENCKAKGERPVANYSPLWEWSRSVGLPDDFISLAWAEFCRQMLPGGVSESKKQADWRKTFRNYVEKNYLKLWALDPQGQFFLTTSGRQAEKFQEHKAAA